MFVEAVNASIADIGSIDEGDSSIIMDEIVGACSLVHSNGVVASLGLVSGQESSQVLNESVIAASGDGGVVIRNLGHSSVIPDSVFVFHAVNLVLGVR